MLLEDYLDAISFRTADHPIQAAEWVTELIQERSRQSMLALA